MKKVILFAALFASSVSAYSQIYITEYMYAGRDTNAFIHEFVELTNFGPTAVDLSEWRLRNKGNFGGYTLSGIGLVAPGESVIITDFNYSTGFRETWPSLGSAVQTDFASTSMGRNDAIRIYDQNDVLVDQLYFYDNNDPALARALGVSAVTTFENLGQNNYAGWFLSTSASASGVTNIESIHGDIGNPGYLNFAYTPVPEPATTVALIAGVALGAAALRRRLCR